VTIETLSHDEAEIRFLDQLKSYGYQPDIFFDVGGSNADWSSLANQVYPDATYHLFEPLADTHEPYTRVLNERLPKHPNFHLHKIGLGNENQIQEMAVFQGGVGSTFIEMERIKSIKQALVEQGSLKDIAPFPVRRMDDYVKEQSLPQPQIIKMDTQGFELAIIEGGKETIRNADILILETWLYRGYGVTTPLLHELMAPLAELNFILVDFGDGYWGNKHTLTAIDAFFMREDFLDKFQKQSNDWKWRVWS
jgi:FkbM family methyltransferase